MFPKVEKVQIGTQFVRRTSEMFSYLDLLIAVKGLVNFMLSNGLCQI